MGSHAAVAALGMRDDQLVAAVLQNWRTAPVDERLRGMLVFLEKVTLTPSEVTPQDVAALHSAGMSDQAIEEALYVCFLFNVIDRLADAFDFELPTTEGFQRSGKSLYTLGYATSSIPG
jgi:alkylhydroperoxidase family enzyme